MVVLLKKTAVFATALITICATSAAYAQGTPNPQTVTVTQDQQTAQGTPDAATTPAAPEKETW
ncbi:hypothetical protein, partial [uncultured Reyranella sp.]|uniref:hypothetical protein n=1 Tax=uncultured Reyranella sp. TaxID=735512 RepID=UPI0025F61E1E